MRAALALAACSVLAAACTPTEPAADIARSAQTSEGVGERGPSEQLDRPAPSDPTTTVPEMVPSTIALPVDPPLNPPEEVATVRRTTTTSVYVEPAPRSASPTVHGDDFWYRLATCESGNGALSANQFQFMGGTAEKVGYYAGASYAEQRAMAIGWAARIHPREGTSAGWPVCWHVAMAGGN